MGPFHGDADKMLKTLIDDHPAGWSTINGADWSVKPGYNEYKRKPCVVCRRRADDHLCQTFGIEWHEKHKKPFPCGENYGMHLGHALVERPPAPREERLDQRPKCYCHGDRSEPAWVVNEENAAGSGCEYAYIIKADERLMLIASSYTDIGSETGEQDVKMIGAFGMGDRSARWKVMQVISFDDPMTPEMFAKMNGF
jgi:hypothetical protein